MKTLDFAPGTRLAAVARGLVAEAPARFVMNDVLLRARYATTNPRDIEAYYRRMCDERLVRGRDRGSR